MLTTHCKVRPQDLQHTSTEEKDNDSFKILSEIDVYQQLLYKENICNGINSIPDFHDYRQLHLQII